MMINLFNFVVLIKFLIKFICITKQRLDKMDKAIKNISDLFLSFMLQFGMS